MIIGKQEVKQKLDKISADLNRICNDNEINFQDLRKCQDIFLETNGETKNISFSIAEQKEVLNALLNQVQVSNQLLNQISADEGVKNVVGMNAQLLSDQMGLLVQLVQMQNANYDRLTLKLNSLEYLVERIYEELKGEEASFIETRRFKNNFKWYINRKSNDNITSYVKTGYIGNSPDYDAIDERIWNLLPSTGIFLDIGANIGAFSLPLASFGWKGYAIEASTVNANLLQKSIEANNFDIQLVRKAIWNKTGKIRFVQNGPQGFVEDDVHLNEDYEVIDAICLDDFQIIPELSNIKSIDFIKMDIEGSEVSALRGMHNFLEHVNYPPIYLEVNIWNLFCLGESPKSLFDEAAVMGYRPYTIYKGSLLEYDINSFPTNPCTDYVLIKNVSEYWQNKIQGKKLCNPIQDVEFVRREMENFKNWSMDYGTNPEEVLAHIAWYALIKEYPDCANDVQIRELKDIIKNKLLQHNNVIFNKMLATNVDTTK